MIFEVDNIKVDHNLLVRELKARTQKSPVGVMTKAKFMFMGMQENMPINLEALIRKPTLTVNSISTQITGIEIEHDIHIDLEVQAKLISGFTITGNIGNRKFKHHKIKSTIEILQILKEVINN